jgi:hypothetical protein
MSNPDPKGRLMAASRIKGQERSRRQQICCTITLQQDKGDKDKKEDEKSSKA